MSEIQYDARRKVVGELIERFSSNQSDYESGEYLESQLRTDFIDGLFEALGWDLVNKQQLSIHKREVLVEKGDTIGRPDHCCCCWTIWRKLVARRNSLFL